MWVVLEAREDVLSLLKTAASNHCIKRGLNEIQILDSDVTNGNGFYTLKGKTTHAAKILSDGTIYCSCEGARFHKMMERGHLCSHLVAALVDMSNRGIDIKSILSKVLFR